MRSIKLMVCAAALLASAHEASAQAPSFGLEVRGGFAVPGGEWDDDDLVDNGWGFGGNVRAQVMPMIAVYAGWERYSFPINDEELDEGDVEADASDQGFRAGLALTAPLAGLPVTPFVELGAVYNTTSIEASDGNLSIEVESDAALGFEGGIGVEMALGPRLSVTPAVRYRMHTAEFDEFFNEEVDVQYLIFDIGLRLRL